MKRQRASVPGLFVLLLSCPAFGQGLIAFSGGSSAGPNGVFQGTATFQVPMPPFSILINAPYAGQETNESVQTLADGTHITNQRTGAFAMTYRDSQGRVRMERSFAMGNTNMKNVPTLVQINDPASGYIYIMDDVTRVAHRIALASAGQRPTAAAMARRANAAAVAAGTGGVAGGMPGPAPISAVAADAGGSGGGGSVRMGVLGETIGAPSGIQANRPAGVLRPNITPPQTSTESLGTQTIDGVLTQGTRITRVIPTGTVGNDGPITMTTDTWYSPDLHLTLLTVTTDPRSGVQTTKYSNFSHGEPDPSLFVVPSGYSIVDETASFTIKWGEQ
jgi:hypothetical protein